MEKPDFIVHRLEGPATALPEPIDMVFDPCGAWPGVLPVRIREACGLIPYFLSEGDPRPAREQFEERYIYGLFESKGGHVDLAGVYRYPEDPPLYPYVRIDLHMTEKVYIYPYAIVTIVQPDGSHYATRLD